MAGVFVQSLAHNFERALGILEAVLVDCPDELWETDMWPEETTTGPSPIGGLDSSAPWFEAYHALTILDYDLSGEFEPWGPPKPFNDNTWSMPNRVFTKPELLGYVNYCRRRVRETLDALTEASAARPLPADHRYAGQPYVMIVGGIPQHTVEHASQIRQFLTSAGVKPSPAARAATGDNRPAD